MRTFLLIILFACSSCKKEDLSAEYLFLKGTWKFRDQYYLPITSPIYDPNKLYYLHKENITPHSLKLEENGNATLLKADGSIWDNGRIRSIKKAGSFSAGGHTTQSYYICFKGLAKTISFNCEYASTYNLFDSINEPISESKSIILRNVERISLTIEDEIQGACKLYYEKIN